MNQLMLTFKLNMSIKIENPSQEREFRRMMKKNGIRVPIRDTYAYEETSKGKRPIYPIYFSLKEYNGRPNILWDTKIEYLEDTTIVKLKAYKKIVETMMQK